VNAFADKLKGNNDKPPEEEPKVEEESTEANVEYTSRPVANLKVGKYQFLNGRLSLPPADAAKFDEFFAVFKKQSPTSRAAQVVRKISRDAAEAIAKQFLRQTQGGLTLGMDTTSNGAPSPSPDSHAE
jgi:hypothetical protein